MAFPETRSARANTQGTNSSSWTLTYPGAGDILDGGPNAIESGDLILVNIGRDGATGTGSISGFTSLFDQAAASSAARGLTFAKVATGTESGNFTYTVGASEQGAWRVVVIKAWHGTISGGAEASSAATGTSANPDPPSFTPSWGAADTYWRALCAYDDGRPSISAYPTNYTLRQTSDSSNGSGGAGMGGATRELNATSDNPGTFTKTGTGSGGAWVAWVVAVRPAAAATNAPAGHASGTGAAQAGSDAITTSAGHSSGTGAANNATVVTGTDANAEVASGTGAAQGLSATLTVSAEHVTGSGTASNATALATGEAEHATGSGAAHDNSSTLSVSAEHVTGSGTSQDASLALTVSAEHVSGSGAANDATVSTVTQTQANAEVASGTGQSLDPVAAVTVPAEHITGTGAAQDATGGVATATEAATGTGTAQDASQAVTVLAEHVTGSGAAQDATVSTTTNVEADAGLASGTGAAADASTALTFAAEHVTGSSAASAATGAVTGSAEHIAASGTASDPSVTVGGGAVEANAEPALGSGAAYSTDTPTASEFRGGPPLGTFIAGPARPRPPDVSVLTVEPSRGAGWGRAWNATVETNDDELALALLLQAAA